MFSQGASTLIISYIEQEWVTYGLNFTFICDSNTPYNL